MRLITLGGLCCLLATLETVASPVKEHRRPVVDPTPSDAPAATAPSDAASSSPPVQVPYVNPDISNWKPQPEQYASTAGDYAAHLCAYIGAELPSLIVGLNVKQNFAQYYPEGSNPSLELLTQVYPPDVIAGKTLDDLPDILRDTGNDIDVRRDFGYGKSGTRAAGNGPLGGLPAFCRIGGSFQTSEYTWVFSESWLPLSSDPQIPLVAPNATDFPTPSTPVYLGPNGEIVQGPPDPAVLDPSNSVSNSVVSSVSNAAHAKNADRSPEKRDVSAASKAAAAPLQGDDVLGQGDGWNGRLFLIGNGGQRGFVPIPNLKQIMSRYRFAVLGSNLGHFSGNNDVSWVVSPTDSEREEKLVDFLGGRAHRTTLEVGQQLVNLFYGPQSGVRTGKGKARHVRSYVAGCSLGGAETLMMVLNWPMKVDGALAGCPAVNNTAMNYAQIQVQKRHRPATARSGLLANQILAGAVRDSVVRQCDADDGVKDGVLTLPETCKPTFKDIMCKGNKAGDNCVTRDQAKNIQGLYAATKLGGVEVYPRFLPGLEESADVLDGSPRKAIDWLLLAEQGKSLVTQDDVEAAFGKLFSLEQIRQWQEAGREREDVSKTDLSPFFEGGGKLIHYSGLADLRISPLASRNWYRAVHADEANKGYDLDQSYRYFEVPGMKHCRDGSGPWQFGGVTQIDAGNRPLRYDTEADAILALVAWVERGLAPDYLVGASYVARSTSVPSTRTASDQLPLQLRSYDYGVAFTRKLCPFPLRPMPRSNATASTDFEGPDAYRNFECREMDIPDGAAMASPTSIAFLALHAAVLVTVAAFLF